MDVSELAFPIKYLLRPFAREVKRSGEFPEELDDLGNVVVILAVLGPGLWIEEVIARDQFKDLWKSALSADATSNETQRHKHVPWPTCSRRPY